MTSGPGDPPSGRPQGDPTPGPRHHDTPYVVSSVIRRPANARRRYMVTISANSSTAADPTTRARRPAHAGAPGDRVQKDPARKVPQPGFVDALGTPDGRRFDDAERDERPSLFSELADPDPDIEYDVERDIDMEAELAQPVGSAALAHAVGLGPVAGLPPEGGRPRPRPSATRDAGGSTRPRPPGPTRPRPPAQSRAGASPPSRQPAAGAKPPGPRAPTPRPSRPRRRWPVAVALVAFALSVGIPLLVRALTTDSTPAAHPATTAPPVTATPPASATASATTGPRGSLVAWAVRALSTQAVIVGDRVTVAALHRAGFEAALTFAGLKATSLHAVDYVADVPGSVTAGGSGAAPRTKLLGLSLPLAVFGGATKPATLREVFPNGTAAARRRLADDADLQKTGGRELLANPALVPDAKTRTALRSGDIDLRIQNVLSDLASTERVYVSDPVIEPAEARAGQPIRSVVVTTSNVQGTQSVLASMPAPYRPDTIQNISPRKIRLVWQPAIAQATTVGG